MTGFYVDVEPDPEVIREWHAALKAHELYAKGMSYHAISVAISEFMGVDKKPDFWRNKLQLMGVARRPHGRGTGRRTRQAA